jgi:Hemerythrin HHE cation binding domain
MPLLVFPSMVRNQVLEQHTELRALLVRAVADAAPNGSPPGEVDAERLRTTARELCQRFHAHLTFEQEALAPVFAVLDSWGPERVMDMHVEHTRQRRELDALLGRFEAGEGIEQMTFALRGLAVDLLRDMEEEEASCLRASLMSADSLTVERR